MPPRTGAGSSARERLIAFADSARERSRARGAESSFGASREIDSNRGPRRLVGRGDAVVRTRSVDARAFAAKGAREFDEAPLQRLGRLERLDQVLELILERGRRLHRRGQLHELLVKRFGHAFELGLKCAHRLETIREILQMALEALIGSKAAATSRSE